MVEKENMIMVNKNGTKFTVVMKSAENASQSFEDVMRKMIAREAVRLVLVEENPV